MSVNEQQRRIQLLTLENLLMLLREDIFSDAPEVQEMVGLVRTLRDGLELQFLPLKVEPPQCSATKE